VTYRRVSALAAALIIILFITRAPASLMGFVLPPTVKTTGFSGTVWEGVVAHVEIPLQSRPFAMGRITWTLNPIGFLRGDLIRVKSDWGNQRVDVAARPALNGSLQVNDAELRIDLGWLRELLPLYVGGQLKADIEFLSITANGTPTSANGRLVWENAAWRAMGGDVSLGSYAVDITTTDAGIRASIITLKGALQVDGLVTIAGDNYRVMANLSGPAARNEAFQQAIALLAVPTGSGYRIELSGTL
jgi:general secretion pathway protein N